MRGVLAQIGWIQDVIVNRVSGHLIDGHLRVELAIQDKQPTVPVKYVDLSPEEEALALATLDPLGAMAVTDAQALDALMRDLAVDDPAVVAMLAELAQTVPDFAPVGMDEQGRLDEKAMTTCPRCGHDF